MLAMFKPIPVRTDLNEHVNAVNTFVLDAAMLAFPKPDGQQMCEYITNIPSAKLW